VSAAVSGEAYAVAAAWRDLVGSVNQHIQRLLATEQPSDPANDLAVKAAMDTAAWTASLTVATWLLFIAAIAAAYFACRTWVATRSQLTDSEAQTTEARRQADAAREQLDRSAEAEERSEATHVAAWLRGEPGGTLELCVRNGNPGPVFDVQVTFHAKSEPAGEPGLMIGGHRMAALAPAASEPPERLVRKDIPSRGLVASLTHPLATPGEPGFYPRDPKYAAFARGSDFQVWDGSPLTTGVAVQVTFRDSSGISWKRDWHGRLAKL
jgi:hypothetical protein